MKDTSKVTRREAVAMAGAATAAAVVANRYKEGPFIRKVKAANNQVQYGIIGTGGRGQYHIKHFNKLDSGRCVALCDIYDVNLQAAIKASKDKPVGVKDYRELLSRKDIDAVVISTPLYTHFPITRDALMAVHTHLGWILYFVWITAFWIVAFRLLDGQKGKYQV